MDMDTYKMSRVRLFSLLMECPYFVETDYCPLHRYRSLSLGEKLSKAYSMSCEIVLDVLTHHDNCVLKMRQSL